MNTDKYKKIFLSEADEKILELNSALLALEKNPSDNPSATEAMRAAHTLKSSATAMEYMGISHLAHTMENLFEGVRLEKKEIQPEAIQLLFNAVDTLGSSINNLKNNKEEINTVALVNQLNKIKYLAFKTKNEKTKNGKTKSAKINQEFETLNREAHTIDRIETIKVDVKVLDSLMNLTEELLVEKMQLSEIVRGLEISNQKKHSLKSNENNQPNINTSGSDIKELPELKKSLENFNRLLANLQYSVTESRMVPLDQIFDRFPRMIRDLAKEQKKKINLIIKGGDIELDRSVVDTLGEPLVHLLKNGIDHGISKDGTLFLSAERRRDRVIVSVRDNGEGINWQRVINVAAQKGIINEKQKEALISDLRLQISDLENQESKIINPKSEIVNLIFHPEFSTSEHITETSGRGIGLSIVKRAAESLGGKVSFESSQRGTSFGLELPLTLAIIQALLVRVSGQIFALPFSQIDRSVRVHSKDIKKVFDREVAVVDNEDVPMIRLDQRFGFDRERKGLFYSEEELRQMKYVLGAELLVISKAGGRQTGIVIDELISEQDIVVKPLKGVMKQPKGFAGITLLGNGRPALILDLATLV